MKPFDQWFTEQGEYSPKTQPDKTAVDPVCSCCGGPGDPDITCRDCGEIVCEDCLALPKPPPHPMIDYNLCGTCYDVMTWGYD